MGGAECIGSLGFAQDKNYEGLVPVLILCRFQINPHLLGLLIKMRIVPTPAPELCLKSGGDCVSTPRE